MPSSTADTFSSGVVLKCYGRLCVSCRQNTLHKWTISKLAEAYLMSGTKSKVFLSPIMATVTQTFFYHLKLCFCHEYDTF